MNHSIAYVKGSVPKIAPKIRLKNATAFASISKLSAILSSSSTNAGVWPSAIMFYGNKEKEKSHADRPAFDLSWKIQIDEGNEVMFAESRHQVYITLDVPDETWIGKHCESLFYWACDGAHGRSDESVNTVNEIFDRHFSLDSDLMNDKATKRINPLDGKEIDTDQLKYLGGGTLLKNGLGMCAGWSKLFRRIAAIHKIEMDVVRLTVKGLAAGGLHPRTQSIVKTDNFNEDYKAVSVNSGQGKTQKTAQWGDHVICKLQYDTNKAEYYDLAYGLRGSSDVKYEYKALQGVTITENIFGRKRGTTENLVGNELWIEIIL